MNSIFYLYLAVSLIANLALIVVVICCLVHISSLHKEMDNVQEERERDRKQNQKIIDELKDGYENYINGLRGKVPDKYSQSTLFDSDK